jgi:hypothetical protein
MYETRPIPEPERELAKDNKIHTTSLSFLVDSNREEGHMMDQCHSMTADVAHKHQLFQISVYTFISFMHFSPAILFSSQSVFHQHVPHPVSQRKSATVLLTVAESNARIQPKRGTDGSCIKYYTKWINTTSSHE